MNDARTVAPPAPTRAQRLWDRLVDLGLDRVRTTTARRRLVVATVAVSALQGIVLALYGLTLDVDVSALAVLLLLGVVMVAVTVMFSGAMLGLRVLEESTGNITALEPDQLDERQVQVRAAAYPQAYRIGRKLVLALLVPVWLLVTFVPLTLSPMPVIAIALVATFLGRALPTLVAAWHLPD